jgi:hypothetical protein
MEMVKNFPKIEKFFTKEALLKFAKTLPKNLGEYNWGLGTMIRLKMLGPKNRLYKLFVQRGYTDKEEMTMEVIRRFHKHICDKI